MSTSRLKFSLLESVFVVALFVGTPAVWMEQGAAYGSEFKRHRSLWTAEELKEADLKILDDGTADRFGNPLADGLGT